MGMKNKHLEHPEDSIFTSGRKGLHTILNFLQEKKSNITVPYARDYKRVKMLSTAKKALDWALTS